MREIIAFAHRGGASAYTENSDLAIAATAARPGFRLETDVRLSADGEIVLNHDETLTRVWGVGLKVSATPWRELATIRGQDGARLMRLPDVLDRYRSLHLNIDPKDDAVVDPLINCIRKYDCAHRILVSSFSTRRIRRIRRLAPEIPTGATPIEVAALVVGSQINFVGKGGKAVAVQVPPKWGPIPVVSRRVVACAHRRGWQVHVWTINSAAQMRQLLALGVDGIMSDESDLLAEVLSTHTAR